MGSTTPREEPPVQVPAESCNCRARSRIGRCLTQCRRISTAVTAAVASAMLHRVGRPLRCQGCRRRVGTASSPLPYRDKRRHSSSAAAAAAAAQRPARPHTALLLVDFQRGFITGEWAEEQGGAEQVLPIATAAARLADLYASEKLAAVPALATRFYLQSPDALPPPNLDAAFSSIPWTSKPGSNVTESEEFAPWLEDRLAEGVTTLVVRWTDSPASPPATNPYPASRRPAPRHCCVC